MPLDMNVPAVLKAFVVTKTYKYIGEEGHIGFWDNNTVHKCVGVKREEGCEPLYSFEGIGNERYYRYNDLVSLFIECPLKHGSQFLLDFEENVNGN